MGGTRTQEQRRRDRVKHRAWMDAQKDKPCADCGMKYPPYVMDFDHVRGEKLFRISGNSDMLARARVIGEIAKCELVCSNCHRERTHRAEADRNNEAPDPRES